METCVIGIFKIEKNTVCVCSGKCHVRIVGIVQYYIENE